MFYRILDSELKQDGFQFKIGLNIDMEFFVNKHANGGFLFLFCRIRSLLS